MNVTAVIASNREQSLKNFLASWAPLPWSETIVIEDGPQRSFVLGKEHSGPLHHFAWADIEADPEVADPAIFSRNDSGIKTYGFWKAARLGADIVIALDDDCLPAGAVEDFVSGHIAALSTRSRWAYSVDDIPTRGFPYFDLGEMPGAVANMGLWHENADLDAPQSLALHRLGSLNHPFSPPRGNRLMHPEQYWPWCAMNIAFQREVLPLMYLPKMGRGVPYGRFDDIWCGIILQRCCRHLGLRLAAGDPHIRHVRASGSLVNLEKEAPGIRANEAFWKLIDSVDFGTHARTPLECAAAVADALAANRDAAIATANPTLGAYLAEEGRRMQTWCSMFRNTNWR